MHRAELARELSDRLTMVHGVHVIRRIDLGDTVLHRFDPTTKTLEISGHLSSGQTVFKMAAELAYLEFGDLIDKLVDEGKFTSEESTTLARLGLANYFAAATVLPYGQFHDVAENFRYDIERLSAFYSVSYETIAHRLSTLQRPSKRGVPLSFIRVDRAGNINSTHVLPRPFLVGSGGGNDVASTAAENVIVATLTAQRTVPECSYVTSPGDRVSALVTDLGTFEKQDGELTLAALAPGATVEDVRAVCGWELRVRGGELPVLDPPTADEVSALRRWDPQGWFLRAI